MCTRIYYTFNLTLWLCTNNHICIDKNGIKGNFTSNDVQTNYTNQTNGVQTNYTNQTNYTTIYTFNESDITLKSSNGVKPRLRHSNLTNSSNVTNTSVPFFRQNLVPPPNLLHLLWLIPGIMLFSIILILRRRITSKNKIMATAKKYLKRSKSWPQISSNTTVGDRSMSHPPFGVVP